MPTISVIAVTFRRPPCKRLTCTIKSIALAYVFWLFGLHYAYAGKWGLQFVFWFTVWGFFGLWWLVDLFRIPSIISNYNRETAITVMRNLATIIG